MTGSAPDAVTIDGKPLGFYHFTGFDSGAHGIMAEPQRRRQRDAAGG